MPEDAACDEAVLNTGKYLEQLPKFDDNTLGLEDEEVNDDNYDTSSESSVEATTV